MIYNRQKTEGSLSQDPKRDKELLKKDKNSIILKMSSVFTFS